MSNITLGITYSNLFYLYLFCLFSFFFFNATATTEIYTLSLHDALPISVVDADLPVVKNVCTMTQKLAEKKLAVLRSEEHTSELQSHVNLVCRLLLEKKKKKFKKYHRLK